MYCGFCGAQIDDDSEFCSECGKSLPQRTPPVREEKPAPSAGSKRGALLFSDRPKVQGVSSVFIVVFALLTIVGIALFIEGCVLDFVVPMILCGIFMTAIGAGMLFASVKGISNTQKMSVRVYEHRFSGSALCVDKNHSIADIDFSYDEMRLLQVTGFTVEVIAGGYRYRIPMSSPENAARLAQLINQ